MSARWVLYTVRQPFKVILMGMAHANSFVPLSFFGEKRKQEGGDFSIVNVKLKHILRVLITCPTPCTMDLKSFCNRIYTIYLYLVVMKKGIQNGYNYRQLLYKSHIFHKSWNFTKTFWIWMILIGNVFVTIT